jgi:hypothetical protein
MRLRESLSRTVAAKVSNGTELIRALAKQHRDETVPTMLAPFDTLLGNGLARGRMTELAGRGARFSIVLAAVAAATSMGEAAALIDLGDHFDPQLADANGIDLRRLLWVRPQTLQEAVAATEMIGASGFQLVALDAGLHPIRGRRVPEASWVRLGRMAEAHGTALLISTPYPLTRTASEAVVRSRMLRTTWLGGGLEPRVLAAIEMQLTLEKHRHRRPGASTTLRFHAEGATATPSNPGIVVTMTAHAMRSAKR